MKGINPGCVREFVLISYRDSKRLCIHKSYPAQILHGGCLRGISMSYVVRFGHEILLRHLPDILQISEHHLLELCPHTIIPEAPVTASTTMVFLMWLAVQVLDILVAI
jgi:hypothetical protein